MVKRPCMGGAVPRTGETAELDAAARVLRALLSGITYSASASFAPGAASSPGLKGTADNLSFVGDLPTGLGTTQRADITLMVSRARLVLRWTLHRHEVSIAPAPEPTETELVRSNGRTRANFETKIATVRELDAALAPNLGKLEYQHSEAVSGFTRGLRS